MSKELLIEDQEASGKATYIPIAKEFSVYNKTIMGTLTVEKGLKVHLEYLEAGTNIIISSSYQGTIQGFESRGSKLTVVCTLLGMFFYRIIKNGTLEEVKKIVSMLNDAKVPSQSVAGVCFKV